MSRLSRMIIPVMVYTIFFSFLIAIFNHPVRCPYEQNIKEIQPLEYNKKINRDYIYNIEECYTNEDDPFCLSRIKGWIVQPDGEYYGPVTFKLILSSKTKSFSIKVYQEKRLDVCYMDQSDIHSDHLNVGFSARFPADVIPNGVYRIGFEITDKENKMVLWTDHFFNLS